VRFGEETRALAAGGMDGTRCSVTAFVRDPKLWSPEKPNLYSVILELRQGDTVLDRVNSYFGFRSIGVEGGNIYLNRDSIYLKTVLDQGYWPESNLTPPSDEAIQYDIRMTKEMGFNGARKHQKGEDPRYLYWADRMGLLVSAEMANAYLYDESYVAHVTKEWLELLERDYNHPSIIIWAPINESWGTPDLSDARQQNHLKALYATTKSVDSTRLVIDNEGWEHTDMTDLFALHDYLRTGDLLYERYKDLGKPGAPIPANLRAALLPGYLYNGSPIYLSEFAGFEYVLPGQQVPNYDGRYLEKNLEAALERMRGLYAAIAKIKAIRGICFTELTDVEHEIAGLMTYDRKPKVDPKLIRELNDLLK
jgi:beta-galactosidase/beta-glucuronidase